MSGAHGMSGAAAATSVVSMRTATSGKLSSGKIGLQNNSSHSTIIRVKCEKQFCPRCDLSPRLLYSLQESYR